MELADKKRRAFRVTLWGSLIDLLLGVLKILVGTLYFSQSLIIDGVHSLSDLFTDVFVLVITKYAYEHPDEEHPYGHGRFETLGTIIIGVLLIIVAVALAFDNTQKIFNNEISQIPKWPTLIVAFVSILSKEWVYRFTLKVGKSLNSQILMANAWHSRSDAFSSIIVFIGLIFTMSGLAKADILVAIILSFFIGKIGWDFILRSVKELLDTSLAASDRKQIKKIISEIDGVKGLHNLRSRRVGDKAILDVNVEVAPNITVSEGHEITTWVAQKIIAEFEYIYDVTVHTDVEDDRVGGKDYVSYSAKLLPLRNIVLPKIEILLGENDFKKIIDIKLHYLEKKIHLDLYFTEKVPTAEIIKKISEDKLFGKIKFYNSF